MSTARFEVVIRIVKDDPEKQEEPKFRHVLHEVAMPIRSAWDWEGGPPPGMTPEAVMAMTDFQVFEQVAAPVIEEMKKAPLPMMAYQCVQQLRDRLKALHNVKKD